MRFVHIFLLSLSLYNTVFGKSDAFITLHLNNLQKDTSSYVYISMDTSTYYVDTVGLAKAIIHLKVDNPFPVMIIANNELPSNKSFWIHEGAFDVLYDMKTYNISFKNSDLNDEYARITSIRDSINYMAKEYRIQLHKTMNDAYRKKDTLAKRRLDSLYKFYDDNEKEFNRLDSIANEVLYIYYGKHNNTFLALEFINSNLNCGGMKRERLQMLFKKLNKQLKKYPLYATCRKNLANPDYIPPKRESCIPK